MKLSLNSFYIQLIIVFIVSYCHFLNVRALKVSFSIHRAAAGIRGGQLSLGLHQRVHGAEQRGRPPADVRLARHRDEWLRGGEVKPRATATKSILAGTLAAFYSPLHLSCK